MSRFHMWVLGSNLAAKRFSRKCQGRKLARSSNNGQYRTEKPKLGKFNQEFQDHEHEKFIKLKIGGKRMRLKDIVLLLVMIPGLISLNFTMLQKGADQNKVNLSLITGKSIDKGKYSSIKKIFSSISVKITTFIQLPESKILKGDKNEF